MKIKCHRIDSEDSQNLQRYIHVINILNCIIPLSTLLKPPRFPALFSLKTKLLCVLCARKTVTEHQCWAVTSYCNVVTVIILLFAVTSVTNTPVHCSRQA